LLEIQITLTGQNEEGRFKNALINFHPVKSGNTEYVIRLRMERTVNSMLLLSCCSILSEGDGGANIWELF